MIAHDAAMQPSSSFALAPDFVKREVEVAEVEVFQAHGGCSLRSGRAFSASRLSCAFAPLGISLELASVA